jgi:oligosaccharyltransferase complex subunit delta (ribophorin II)
LQKQKDLPTQLLKASKPLEARVLVGSFGSAKAYDGQAFRLRIDLDPSEALPSEKALRYGKLPEIHHIFRSDPKSPPVIISLFFLVVVLAALPALAIAVSSIYAILPHLSEYSLTNDSPHDGLQWLTLGANANHLPVALKSSPVSHILFVGSIVGLEGIFYLYYTTWNLFQILPAVAVVGTVTFLSGSRALGEVQERRLAGLR